MKNKHFDNEETLAGLNINDISCKLCAVDNCIKHTAFSPFFQNASEYIKQKTFQKGESLFIEGNFVNGVFLLHKGKIKLTYTGNNDKEQIVRLFNQGDLVGYRALINDEPYQVSAVAIEDSWVCFIPKNIFMEALLTNPQLCLNVAKILSNDLKLAERRIISLTQKNVRARMADALLFFAQEYGFHKDGQTINVLFSRSEISDFVGTSSESAIRVLSEFQREKLIELNGKKIRIIQFDPLSNIAEG